MGLRVSRIVHGRCMLALRKRGDVDFAIALFLMERALHAKLAFITELFNLRQLSVVRVVLFLGGRHILELYFGTFGPHYLKLLFAPDHTMGVRA